MSQTIPSTTAPVITSFTPEVQSPAFSGLIQEVVTLNTIASTSSTLTIAQMLGGLVFQPAGAAINTTLDTGPNIFQALQSPVVGSSLTFTVRNTATAANTITIVAGSGGTISGTATIAQNNQRSFRVVITAVGDQNGVGATYTAYTSGSGTY